MGTFASVKGDRFFSSSFSPIQNPWCSELTSWELQFGGMSKKRKL